MSRMTGRADVGSDGGALAGVRRDRRGVVLGVVIAVVGVLVPLGGVSAAGAAAPTVVTESASSVTQTSATLNATVNPGGEMVSDCHFEYVTAGVHNAEIFTWEREGIILPCALLPGSGTSPVAVSAPLASLSAGITYVFRIVATNPGGTSIDSEPTFTTLTTSASGTSTNPSTPAEATDGPLAATASGGTGTVTVGQYGSNPAGTPPFMSSGGYIDAYLTAGNTFTSLEFTDCELNGGNKMYWDNGGTWEEVSDETAPSGSPPCITVTINDTTHPDLKQMTGTVFGVAVPAGPPPTIKKLSPKKGPAAGGTSVTITGTGFAGVSAVKFGSTNATKVTFNSATSITAVSPAGTRGLVDVAVTTPNGTSAISTKDHFTFEAPTITNLSPPSGSKVGGTTVTVTGSGFGLGSSTTVFKFGTTLGTSVNCTSTTTCEVVAPAAAKTGTVDVRATVSGKTSKKKPADHFTYN
jgi:hypothetical protein